jgi:hypothetical protein
MAQQSSNTTVPRSPYGIKFAKAGFDTRTATDYELLFSSGWPSVAIAFTATAVFPSGTGTVDHPLGFPPLTMAWAQAGGVITHRHFPSVTSEQIIFSDGDSGDGFHYYIQCYSLDISKQANYAFIPTPPAQIGTYDKNYGAKFAKPGKSISSQNLNDFIFHTRAMSPAVLSVNTTFDATSLVGGSNTITTNNPNKYVPWAFGYAQDNANPGVWVYAAPYAQAVPRLFVNLKPNSFTLSTATNSPAGSLITLRDPLFVASEVQVTY